MKAKPRSAARQSKLVGEVVIKMRQFGDDLLEFYTASGKIVRWSACGECCSRSYFQHIEGLDALLGKAILSVDPNIGSRWMQDEISQKEIPRTEKGNTVQKRYSYWIKTRSGRCLFDLRNDSNGFYSGWISEAPEFVDQYGRKRPSMPSASRLALRCLEKDF